METSSTDKRVWTRVNGGREEQPYDGHGRYLGTAGSGRTSGGTSGGGEVRGKVSPPQKPKYPPPPAPRQPHLTYSQKSGELRDAAGRLMDKGHSGFEDYRDKPEFEDGKNRGVIPRGNYKVTEVIEDTSKDERRKRMGRHMLRLEPADAETRQRLKEMIRDGFWMHNGSKPTHSQGCILLPETTRRRIPVGSILRVTL